MQATKSLAHRTSSSTTISNPWMAAFSITATTLLEWERVMMSKCLWTYCACPRTYNALCSSAPSMKVLLFSSLKLLTTANKYLGEQRQQNFGMVQRAFIRVVDQDTQQEIVRFDLTEEVLPSSSHPPPFSLLYIFLSLSSFLFFPG